MREKIKTGITTLDEILRGGIPTGRSAIIAGSCGTGKTIMAEQFLFSGAREGRNGIYMSLSEPKEKIMEDMEDFTFYDKELVENGTVKIIDLSYDARLQGVGLTSPVGMSTLIKKIMQETKPQLVVIDSITAFVSNLGNPEKIRGFVYDIGMQLREANCTSMLISETPPQELRYSIYGVEEFIADGVMLITDFERKGELLRAFQVIKMRGVKHSRSKYVLEILEDGVHLIPLFKAGME